MKTGIYIRAEVDHKWGSWDIGDPAVSDEQVLSWLRSSGGYNPFAANVVGLLIGICSPFRFLLRWEETMKILRCIARSICARVFKNQVWDGHCWASLNAEDVVCIDCGKVRKVLKNKNHQPEQ